MSELRELIKKETQNKKYIFWCYISWKHQLSESFIREFKERIIYSMLKDNKNVTITEKIKQLVKIEK